METQLPTSAALARLLLQSLNKLEDDGAVGDEHSNRSLVDVRMLMEVLVTRLETEQEVARG